MSYEKQYFTYVQKVLILECPSTLTYVFPMAKLDAVSHRWLAAISSYNLDSRCKPGSCRCQSGARAARQALPYLKFVSDLRKSCLTRTKRIGFLLRNWPVTVATNYLIVGNR